MTCSQCKGYAKAMSPFSCLRWFRTLAVSLVLSCLASGQSLSLSLSSGGNVAGKSVPLVITLTVPVGSPAPAALQWTYSYPPADIASIATTEGKASTDANKTITCNTSTGVTSCTCLIVGMNQNSIATGPIAVVNIALAASPVDTTIPITLSAPVAAGPDGTAIPITVTGGIIAVFSPISATYPPIIAIHNVAITPVTMVGSGGAGGPYVFAATGLPAGLTMDTSGNVSGTPTIVGTLPYTVAVTDSAGNTATVNCVVTVGLGNCASYKLTRTPVGPVIVYRNGLLQNSTTDYATTKVPGSSMPLIAPLKWLETDSASVIYSKAVPLSFTYNAQLVSYWGYTLNREDWNCSTGKVLTTAKPKRVRKVISHVVY